MMKSVGTVPGYLPNVSKTYCACTATHSLNSSVYGWAAPRMRSLSVQAPGVSGLYTPPGPNLRSANFRTAAAMSGTCGRE